MSGQQAAMQCYFFRHAKDGDGPYHDPTLKPAGKEQAIFAGKALYQRGHIPGGVFTSPHARCVGTGRHITAALRDEGVALSAVTTLGPAVLCQIKFTKLVSKDDYLRELRSTDNFQQHNFPYGIGKEWYGLDFPLAMAAWIKRVREVDPAMQRPPLVVTHQKALEALLPPEFDIRIPYCCGILCEFNEESQEWEVLNTDVLDLRGFDPVATAPKKDKGKAKAKAAGSQSKCDRKKKREKKEYDQKNYKDNKQSVSAKRKNAEIESRGKDPEHDIYEPNHRIICTRRGKNNCEAVWKRETARLEKQGYRKRLKKRNAEIAEAACAVAAAAASSHS